VFVVVGKQKTNATFADLMMKDGCVAWCGASSPLPSVLGSYDLKSQNQFPSARNCVPFMLKHIQKVQNTF
jgi:hypothetical protein